MLPTDNDILGYRSVAAMGLVTSAMRFSIDEAVGIRRGMIFRTILVMNTALGTVVG
jgi:hypothetical protein